jgi:peptidoglycan/LPS O-acetylase OafA/YrhL
MDGTKTQWDSTELRGVSDGKVERFAVLDGWRAISILLVLGAHLLPLGPRAWDLNETAAKAGMALFFTLSGFLITKTLIEHPEVRPFLVRRLFRIVPLAWLALAICMPIWGAAAADYAPNFFFYANLPPQHLLAFNGHFWSLCVEVQFYLGIALVVGAFGRRGLLVVPLACLAVTAHRLGVGA